MIPRWFVKSYFKKYQTMDALSEAWWGYRIGVQRERMRATCGNRLTKWEYANLAKMAAEGKK